MFGTLLSLLHWVTVSAQLCSRLSRCQTILSLLSQSYMLARKFRSSAFILARLVALRGAYCELTALPINSFLHSRLNSSASPHFTFSTTFCSEAELPSSFVCKPSVMVLPSFSCLPPEFRSPSNLLPSSPYHLRASCLTYCFSGCVKPLSLSPCSIQTEQSLPIVDPGKLRRMRRQTSPQTCLTKH